MPKVHYEPKEIVETRMFVSFAHTRAYSIDMNLAFVSFAHIHAYSIDIEEKESFK